MLYFKVLEPVKQDFFTKKVGFDSKKYLLEEDCFISGKVGLLCPLRLKGPELCNISTGIKSQNYKSSSEMTNQNKSNMF